jgi:hypothetical protein
MGGIRRDAAGQMLLSDGTPLDAEGTYRLLTTDYMYGNTKYPFSALTETPYETGVSWRQPVIDWISAQQSTPGRPIEGKIDDRP